MSTGSNRKQILKDFDSIFVPQLKVPVDNYITELIVQNRVNWLIQKGRLQSKPLCAFWQKDILDKHPEFNELANVYKLEIAYVKNLLKSFLPKAIIVVLQKHKVFSLTFAKLPDQQKIIYSIWKEDIKLKNYSAPRNNTIDIIDRDTDLPKDPIIRPTMSSKLTGLL